MAWAHKWWKANAFLAVAALRFLFGVQPVIFVDRASSSNRGCRKQKGHARTVRTRWRRIFNFETASEGAARGLFTMMVVLLSSCVGFSAYWHWSDEMALTNGIIASSNCHNQNCAKSKRALSMEVIGGFALPLLVTVSIYLYRWNNRPLIRSLNRNSETIYRSQPNCWDDQRRGSSWKQYGRLATKQVFEVMALGVLWLNLRPFSHTKQDGDDGDYHVGKLISSIASMLPAIVCLLVSIEMGINFSSLARRLNTLNVSLNNFIRCICVGDCMKRVNPDTNVIQTQYMHRISNDLSCKPNKRNYLRHLILQYDVLGQYTVDVVQFYAPILLSIVGMHFVLLTMQLFLCYRQMSRTTSDSVNINQLGQTLLPMLSAISSAGQIMFLVDIAAEFNRKLDDGTVVDLGRLSSATHRVDRNTLTTYDAKELDKCVTTLSLIVYRIRDGTMLYGYFDLDRSLVMTIITSTCSYLIVLMQVM
ncbi:uncharacterized protein LOC128305254 [Anopheles moucheti]|uniref:uncharacterized protein LOC128305254 n=1 Tax=Anopheles moucheti TaxID=186751 RepID=UPI0022F07EF1|nr:uncharacterized protein LOC128305254 [Anopheles moucheti]